MLFESCVHVVGLFGDVDVANSFYAEKLLAVFGGSADIFGLFGDVDLVFNLDVWKQCKCCLSFRKC